MPTRAEIADEYECTWCGAVYHYGQLDEAILHCRYDHVGVTELIVVKRELMYDRTQLLEITDGAVAA